MRQKTDLVLYFEGGRMLSPPIEYTLQGLGMSIEGITCLMPNEISEGLMINVAVL